ncbi:succinate dehydrogenase, cytochrome b556 subunit [Candidatus Vondammii sp. HM_W22]|uniref:succinate dehydrogenase, cytochrome b556 subunit n=1 Tax=Candidatus Vondammii sp. HM_W22 TaxID=2687299 RepID=UPI001F144349|nr:succinate dehydrogenase, cytochrome b556 subunit [Candidatus Vondammii sp. HM_W22]
MMHKNRPVFLNLLQFRFPMTAIMSVGHRTSGVMMILGIPYLVYVLDRSLSGAEGFADTMAFFDQWLVRLVLFVVLWALIHHLLAGIRFLLIDFQIGVDKKSGRLSALAVMISAPIFAILIELLS